MVYFVGSGHCSPGLPTVKEVRLLKSANVVIHDSLVTRAMLDLIPEGTIRVPIRGGPHAHGLPLPEIAEMIIGHVQGGGTVVRLMNGDPVVFGRLPKETEFLNHAGIKYAIIPGIASVLYSAALSRAPLTERGFSSSFATSFLGQINDMSSAEQTLLFNHHKEG